MQWGSILKGEAAVSAKLKDDGIERQTLIKRKTYQSTIVVAGDNDTPALLSDAVVGASALVHEATYTRDVLDKILARDSFNPMHSSAHDVASFAEQAGVPTLILTHFSARFMLFDDPKSRTPNMGHIRAEAEAVYGGRLILAEDLLRVLI